MNKQYKPVTKGSRGFTIIEVVLVLAIAGLIFLMVFIALPALQRGQRDTQRKDDLSRINTQISNFQGSNRGKIPTTTGASPTIGSFVKNYLGNNTTTQTGSEYFDPSTGEGYTFITNGSDPTRSGNLSQISYEPSKICGDDGAAVGTYDGTTATARNYVLRVLLEGQIAPYCLDNR